MKYTNFFLFAHDDREGGVKTAAECQSGHEFPEQEHDTECGCEHEHHHHEHDVDDCDCGCEHEYHHHEHDDCGCGHEHHHHEHDDCGHEHHHHEHDDCGCEHEHHHHEHDDCDCGCEHEHHHHEHDDCDCGCEHEHHHHEHDVDDCGCGHEHHPAQTAGRVYILQNLGCAHCASKMEERINALPAVQAATITYATKQLRLTAADPDGLLPAIQDICSSIESEVRVVPRVEKSSGTSRSKVFMIENLGCAHCASKMEQQINELPGVEEAVLTFATKQLRVTARTPERFLEDIRRICTAIEPEVKVFEREPAAKAAPNAQEHEEKASFFSSERATQLSLLLGAALFIISEILEHTGAPLPAVLTVNIAAYIILGGKIVLTALKGLTRGLVLDENFLMSVATLGAFAIQEYPEAVGVMLFYRIGEHFEDRAVEKSRSQIMEAVDMRPEEVNLVSGEQISVIAAADAQAGDVLLIRPGDRIPLDGVIVDGESRIDTSPITGEPVPVRVTAGDALTSGCLNTSGQLRMRVEKPLSESMVTRILDSVENAAASKPKIDRFITRFARVYTPIVVLLALAAATLPPLLLGQNWNYWVYTALTFLVMSCPCALVLSVPLAFFSGIGAGSRKGILFKGGLSIEAMQKIKAVVMDKTGTITRGNFAVQKILPARENISENELLALCAGCELSSTHPIGHSILTAARERNLDITAPEAVEETAGQGITARWKDYTLHCGNRKLMEAHGVAVSENVSTAGTEVLLARNEEYLGKIIIADTIKDEAAGAVRRIKSQGIATVMLTGDAQESAEEVARATGIDEVHARLLPQDKLERLEQTRGTYGPVMFVGDGINDAPVLAGADVGAAMGSGADAAIEAADVVFMTSSMEAIPQALDIARSTSRISWQNVVFALVVKVAVMILGLAGFASMWAAVFADTGVAMICVLNSIRILYRK